MADSNKVAIKQLGDKANYGLWHLRVETVCQKKGLNAAFFRKEAPDDINLDKFEQQKLKVSGFTVLAFTNSALSVVKSVKGEQASMLTKLDARFDLRTTPSKIFKMGELVSLCITSPRSHITKHIKYRAIIAELLEAMQASIEEYFKVKILIAFIGVDEMSPVIAAFETLTSDDVKWDNFAERLFEKWREFIKHAKSNQSNLAEKVVFD